MTLHPLIELANDREVKQAKGFRQAATTLTGEALAEKYRRETENAPRRHEAGQKYLVGPRGKRRRGARARRNDEDLAIALVGHCHAAEREIALPEAGALEFLDYWVPLKARPAGEAPAAKDADPHRRVGKIDLFGLVNGERMAVGVLRFLPSGANRGVTGDTPLRALLEGLAACAIAAANLEALRAELGEHYGRSLSAEPPVLLLIGSPRYWQLCRKREAQKGAAWIAQLERLGREIETSLGVAVRFLVVELGAEPAWEDRDGRPALTVEPKLAPAWEPSAGKVKPKPKPKAQAPVAEPIVEADPTRPVRAYELCGSYSSGDCIEHPTLGRGVVQGVVGPGKIKVIFDGKPRLLVHERPTPSP